MFFKLILPPFFLNNYIKTDMFNKLVKNMSDKFTYILMTAIFGIKYVNMEICWIEINFIL